MQLIFKFIANQLLTVIEDLLIKETPEITSFVTEECQLLISKIFELLNKPSTVIKAVKD